MTKKKNRDPEKIRERLKQKINETQKVNEVKNENETQKVNEVKNENDEQFDLLKRQIGEPMNTNKNRKIFVATPCYNGTVHVKFMQSIMNLQILLLKHNIIMEFFSIPFDSLIPRARNACCTRFMQSQDSTHLMFIDADIEFNPYHVVKMLNEDKDVIGGCYSKKAVDFDMLYKNFNKFDNKLQLLQSAGKYAFNFKPQQHHKVENGVIEVLDAPTGFLMIKKCVIEEMMEKYPEYEYKNDVGPYNVSASDRFFDLFPSQIFEDNGMKRYLSEDYGFCRLWQKLGGKIFIDLTVELNHIGQFVYHGNPLLYLKNNDDVNIT